MDEPNRPTLFSSPPEFVRKHGLNYPLNLYQIFSWIVLFLEVCSTFLVLLPPLNIVLRIVSAVVISILIALTCYNALKATMLNPTDPKVTQAQEAWARGETLRLNLKFYCVVCRAHVQAKTKHCGSCNRCVEVFDHHCIWLNNCIGKINYRYFVRAIVALCAACLTKLGFGIYVIVQYHLFSEDFHKNSQAYYNTEGPFDAIHHLMIASCVVNAILVLVLVKLICLHIWLAKKGLTTYESIVMDRTKMKNQGQEQASSPKKSRIIRNLEEDTSSATLNKSKNPNVNSQTEHEIRLETHPHDHVSVLNKHESSPGVKPHQTEPSSETARFDTTPFINSYPNSSPKNKTAQKKGGKKIENIYNDLRTSSVRQDTTSQGVSVTKDKKQNETFFEEEKQESQKNIKLDLSEDSPHFTPGHRKALSITSNTDSNAPLTKGWSGRFLSKTPKVSRIFSSEMRTQSPTPTIGTPTHKSPLSGNGDLERGIDMTSSLVFKSYQKINVFNLDEARKSVEQKPDASFNIKSPCFGDPDLKASATSNTNFDKQESNDNVSGETIQIQPNKIKDDHDRMTEPSSKRVDNSMRKK